LIDLPLFQTDSIRVDPQLPEHRRYVLDHGGRSAHKDERGVIVDYRPGAGIRMAPHFYNTEQEIDHAMATLAEIVGSSA